MVEVEDEDYVVVKSNPETERKMNTFNGEVVVTLEELIGDMSHLDCKKGSTSVRGKDVVYWMYENEKKPLGDVFPVIALHGGPSFCHNYLKPLILLADMGYPVIFYDQCGCGESKNGISDPRKPDLEYLLTVEYYVEELNKIISELGLTKYYVYGSSWGSMLAQEFAITQPNGLLGLLLDGTFADAKVYIETQWRDRMKTLPLYTQKLLKELTEKKDFDSPVYHLLEETLTGHFTCRLIPQARCFRESEQGQNSLIYSLMQGASEFCTGGVLEHWTTVERLHTIRVPTLVVRGEYDTMTEEASQQVVDGIPTAWPLICIPRASHCKLLEEPHACCNEFKKFLVTCDANRAMQM